MELVPLQVDTTMTQNSLLPNIRSGLEPVSDFSGRCTIVIASERFGR